MPPRWSHRSRRRSARCRFGPGSWNAIAAAKPREYIHELNGRRELILSLHQMLGVATNIQGAAAQLQAAGTILLLQIDSDTSLHQEFMFCDMGAAQFWIDPADLAKGRFYKAGGTTGAPINRRTAGKRGSGYLPACSGGALAGEHGSWGPLP